MRSEINFLKKALDRVASAGPFGCYHFSGGVAWAQNSQMQAVVPFLLGEELSLPGAELEIALSRMSSDPTLTLDGKELALKAGRIKATVPIVNQGQPAIYSLDVDWKPLPKTLILSIKSALCFMLGNQIGWAAAIRLQDGRLTTVNNMCGIDIAIPDLVCPPSLLTKELVEFLLANDPPSEYAFKEKIAFLFRWPDGRTLQAQLVDSVMPPTVENIFASAGRDAPIEITADWRAAFEDASAISEKNIEVRSDSIRVGRGTSKVTIDVATGLPEKHVSLWSKETISAMLEVATYWNPNAYPRPAIFKGPALYGLVAGLKG